MASRMVLTTLKRNRTGERETRSEEGGGEEAMVDGQLASRAAFLPCQTGLFELTPRRPPTTTSPRADPSAVRLIRRSHHIRTHDASPVHRSITSPYSVLDS